MITLPSDEKKGITVKIDAGLHAEVRQYLEEHGMTMAEFVTLALDDELHPKIQMKEGKSMENMRTIAVQVPEDLFQRIKEYLQRNNMTQKEFMIGLIEDELERDLTEREGAVEPQNGSDEYEEDEPDEQEETALADDSDGCEDSEDESEDETQGLIMGM
ncbi:MAG: hypothetical protein ACI4F6_01825 [Acutalibacteraceae bacterium]